MPLESKVKTCTIKKDHLGHWFAILVIEVEDVFQVEPMTAIGVDVGLKRLITLSNGAAVKYPRYHVQAEQKLAVAQRQLSRKKKGSANRQKAKLKVAKISQMCYEH